jgi:hypothetical protein
LKNRNILGVRSAEEKIEFWDEWWSSLVVLFDYGWCRVQGAGCEDGFSERVISLNGGEEVPVTEQTPFYTVGVLSKRTSG